jgi:Uma2 family endonuclease
MVQYNPLQYLPTAEELPDTDGKPVDNELQILVASLLADILTWLWRARTDWFWGINMGIYYDPDKSAIVPDGFLSLGVQRFTGTGGRLSYVLWHEKQPPILAIEFVSKTYGNEYEKKFDEYASFGVSYYVVYNPQYYHRDKHNPFEVYRLVNQEYVLQSGEPVWLAEIGLGIGRGQGTYRGWTREWLYWYDEHGNQLLPSEEIATAERQRAEQERQRAEQERQRAERLAERLRQLGVDPDTL